MVLERIVSQKRVDVAVRRSRTCEASLRARLGHCEPPRSLLAALSAPQTGFILECKKSSPSQGLIRENFDLGAIADAYAPFASAVSVLTDEPHFGGRLEFLDEVRARVGVPVLCKDFVVDPYQILEARTHGADAILLMASVLDDAALERCLALCRELGMEALLEVHDEAELERALRLEAPILGINNRNLRTLEVSLETTAQLAPRVPRDRILVCESGIRTHGDVRRLRPLVDAFLVGTSLMREANLPEALRSLLFGKVKICGLTSPGEARAARDVGASWGGLIFAPQSPRKISMARAQDMVGEVPMPAGWVGVFVDAPASEVVHVARELGLAAVQLHGGEDEKMIEALCAALPSGVEIWRALRVRDRIARWPAPSAAGGRVVRTLLDTWSPLVAGGTGSSFAWDMVKSHADREHFILAGGLSPANAGEAASLGTWALDVNSGVETAPGVKCPRKMEALFGALRGHGRTKEVHHAP